MHIAALSSHLAANHIDLLRGMFRLRRRVFLDRLNWSVSTSGELELDIYDTLTPHYLIVVDDDGHVVGSVRLLPTTGPTMLAETFPELLDGAQVPRSEKILESSRFCVDTEVACGRAGDTISRVTFLLFAAMIERLRAAEADAIVTVTDVRMERILRRAGWPLERIAPPRRIGETLALAGFLHRSEVALSGLYERAGVAGPVLSGAGPGACRPRTVPYSLGGVKFS